MKLLTEALLDSPDIEPLDRDLTVAVARDLRSVLGAFVETDPIFTAWYGTGTTIGESVWGTASLGAISFIRINADDTVTARLASDVLTDIGALSSSNASTQDGYFGRLFLKDTVSPSHYLEITVLDDLTDTRELQIDVGDSDRVLTFAGDATISGTNTGDQTTIVGISGTKAEFDTACSDGNFLYVGDVTQYTDELAQDAIGGIFVAGTFVTLTYNDGVPSIVADLSATGTPGSTNFLRGDNTWAVPPVSVLGKSGATGASTNTLSEEVLGFVAIAGNLVGANDEVRAYALFDATGGAAGNRIFRIRIHTASTVGGTVVQQATLGTGGGGYSAMARIQMKNATNAQEGFGQLAAVFGTGSNFITAAIDTTSTWYVLFTSLKVTSGADGATLRNYSVERIRA